MHLSLNQVRRSLIVRLAGANLLLFVLFQGAAMPPEMRRLTVTSKPRGATIYIDGIQAGRTPLSFPMPMGRYTLVLIAPGYQQYRQRILVPDAPSEVVATLVPKS
jgi:hypothetical protein